MNIVVASDDNFVQHCTIMLTSLLENNKDDINIYLITQGISEVNNNIINNIVTKYGANYFYICINSNIFNELPMPDLSALSHISIATYFRLLIPTLLPISISKVLYLDCDIIVRKSIDELWSTNIDNYAVAAVYQIAEWNIDAINRLKYPFSYGYFNAGVLLMNLNYWRENNVSEKLFKYLIDNKNNIIYHDQDALNGVLFDKCFRLPCKWNLLTSYFRKDILEITEKVNGKIIENNMDYKQQIVTEIIDPTVIHFVSKPKPWDKGCTHPFKFEYFKYAKLTPWYKFAVNESITFKVKQIIKKILNKSPYFHIKLNK